MSADAVVAKATLAANRSGSDEPAGYRTWQSELFGGRVSAVPSQPDGAGRALWSVTATLPDGRSATVQVTLTGQFGPTQLAQGSATKTQLDAALAAQGRPAASGVLGATRPDTEVDHRVQAIRMDATMRATNSTPRWLAGRRGSAPTSNNCRTTSATCAIRS
jgi:hypothetical protein